LCRGIYAIILKMRILHFYKTCLPETFGGVEQVIYQLAEKSASYGAYTEVLALSRNPQKTINFRHHKVHQEKLDFQIASNGFSWKALSAFKKLVKSVDVVHYHYPWPFMDAVHFAAQCKKPTVVTYHSDIVRQRNLMKLYALLQSAFLRDVDCIVATSPDYMESSKNLQKYKNKTRVVPIGLDEDLYMPIDEHIAKSWARKLPEKFFLFVGVLRYYKGLDVLLTAMREAEFPLVIVGNGPEESRLHALAQKWNLQHVYFLGSLPDQDKNVLLSLCYGVVLPSSVRSEAFGVSLLEGAMFGKPLICCRIQTGTTFINCHGETGIVVPPNDSQALGIAMQSLWNDPGMASTMGRAARKRYLKCFTADIMAESYCKIYHEISRV